MKNFIIVATVIFIAALAILVGAAHAMGKQIHYVSALAPDEVVSQSLEKWSIEEIEGSFYKISVMFPRDHDPAAPKQPGRQKGWLIVRSVDNRNIKFRTKSLEVTDGRKNYIEKLSYNFHKKEKGYQNLEEILDNQYEINDLSSALNIYTNIPSRVEKLHLNFEIEITSADGKIQNIKKSIPLKKSYSRLGFFHGLFK